MTITLEQAAKWHEARAAEAHQCLSCGSENWEYRAADKVHDMHRMAAEALRRVAAAHADGMEEAARIIEEGFDRGIERKQDTCAHGKYEWEDCEQCAEAAIRAATEKEE